MAKQYKLMYLDSCIIIDCLEKRPGLYDCVAPILEDAEADRIRIVASVICKIEVLKIQGMDDKEARELISDFFEHPYVMLYAVDNRIAEHAARIRKEARLRTPDAIHLATAIEKHVDVFVTRDNDFSAGKGKRRTVLDLKQQFRKRIEIITPMELVPFLSPDARQYKIPESNDNEEAEPQTT